MANSATGILNNGSYSDYCATYLQEYTNCLNISQANAIFDLAEPTVTVMSKYLDLQCSLKLQLLIDNPLSDVENTTVPTVPNKTQCDHVLNVCEKDLKKWNLLSLPEKCIDLLHCAPESPLDNKDCRITLTSNASISTQMVNCSKGFFYSVEKMGCIPECDVWTLHSERELLISKILTIIPAVVCTVAGIAVLMISWAHCQKL